MRNWLIRNERTVVFTAVLGGLLGVVFWYHWRVVSVAQEALVRSGVGSDLLEGAVEGRQGLVGSLKWGPLPTLLILPLVKIPGLGTTGLAFPVVNALVSAFTLTLLNGWWARFGIPRGVRFPLLCVYQMSPQVLAAVLTGSSTTVMLLLIMAAAYFLVDWLHTLDVRSLAYLGVLGGLAVITHYQTIVMVVMTTVVILVRVVRQRERSFRGATVLIYLIPSLYLVGLWFVANWLIMGDAFYFLRGVWGGARLVAEVRQLDVEWHLYVMPLVFLLVALGAHDVRRRRARAPVRVTLAVLVLLAAVAWPYATELYLAKPEASTFGRHRQQVIETDEILNYLATNLPEAKVFVPGYTGYQFLIRSKTSENFVHLMSLDLREVQRRTRGQRLFFLVPKPEGVYRWEDVSLDTPWLFDDYMKHVLTDPDASGLRMSFVRQIEWDHWHLVEAVRAENRPAGR